MSNPPTPNPDKQFYCQSKKQGSSQCYFQCPECLAIEQYPKKEDFTYNGKLMQPHFDNAVKAYNKMIAMEEIPDQQDWREVIKKEAELFAYDQVFDRNKFRQQLTKVGIVMGEFGYNLLQSQNEVLQKEVDELKEWKKQFIEVLPDFQVIGRLLKVELGHAVHDKIIPGIEALQKENAELKEKIKVQETVNYLTRGNV